MDLQTLRKNLDKGKYQYFEEVFADIQQIWTNCKLYNQSGSEIYKLAENMERRSKKLIKELRSSLKLQNSGSSSGPQKDENELGNANQDGLGENQN